jgi:3-methyladenine DNA glycosylase/8-oxoguanine DNA glycosylase
VIEARIVPRGRYALSLTTRRRVWSSPLPDGGDAVAWQDASGAVTVRAPDDDGVERARFMLALDDDTTPFERAFADDRLLGASIRAFRGMRPLRRATVAHAALRAVCGQLVTSAQARAMERSITRSCGEPVPTQEALARFSPAQLRAHGLATHRASALVRLCRTVDLERLHDVPTDALVTRICRERGLGPWSAGVIALEGLGRYDHGLVGDLGLVKLVSALRGHAASSEETAELLAPYGEWRGLAGLYLMVGFEKGLVPGATPDRARAARSRARAA